MHFAPTIYSDYLLPWSAMNLFVHGFIFLKVKIMIKMLHGDFCIVFFPQNCNWIFIILKPALIE